MLEFLKSESKKWHIMALCFILLAIRVNYLIYNTPDFMEYIKAMTGSGSSESILFFAFVPLLSAVFGGLTPLVFTTILLLFAGFLFLFVICYIKSIINMIKNNDNSIFASTISTMTPLITLAYFCPKFIYYLIAIFTILFITRLTIFKKFKYYSLIIAIISFILLILYTFVFKFIAIILVILYFSYYIIFKY